ncbi:conserved hypothetical protein [methanotrophic bacterial endosymbiont of Bathymodiolus sp.]|nr:conserved hypothetical protein [methanotrophic bacterial endosymbiont of Bathymodiolus sp.]
MLIESSPRPWGCFPYWMVNGLRLPVFPTPVGVFLCRAVFPISIIRLPHARGGVSEGLRWRYYRARSSPRPWGCFSIGSAGKGMPAVFPTPVGVFPASCQNFLSNKGLPHARGGVSKRSQSI